MHNILHTEEAKLKMRLAKLGKHLSPTTEFKPGKKSQEFEANRVANLARGSSHYKWTETPSYDAVHYWVRKQLGKPRLCSQCGFTSDNGRQFHWANISGQYKRELKDWKRLCVSCHFKMDGIHKRGWATRRARQFV